MKYILIFFLILVSSNILPVFAQLETEYVINQIDEPLNCEQTKLAGPQAYVPFTLKIFHPGTDDYEIVKPAGQDLSGVEFPSVTQNGKSLIFHVENQTGRFEFDYIYRYPKVPDGATITEVWSEGIANNIDVDKLQNKENCRKYVIVTEQPPQLPNLQQYLKDAGVEAVEEFKNIVPALNINTDTITILTGAIVIFIAVDIILGFVQNNKWSKISKEKIATIDQISSVVKNSQEILEKADTATNTMINTTEDFQEKIIPEINSRVNTLLQTILVDVRTALLPIVKENEKRDKKIQRLQELKPEPKMNDDNTIIETKTLSTLISSISEHPIVQNIASKIKKPEEPKLKLDFDDESDITFENAIEFYMKNTYLENMDLYNKYWTLTTEHPEIRIYRLKVDALSDAMNKQSERNAKS